MCVRESVCVILLGFMKFSHSICFHPIIPLQVSLAPTHSLLKVWKFSTAFERNLLNCACYTQKNFSSFKCFLVDGSPMIRSFCFVACFSHWFHLLFLYNRDPLLCSIIVLAACSSFLCKASCIISDSSYQSGISKFSPLYFI